MNAKQDAERLVNEVVPVAKRMLEDYGDFFPYGAYIKPSGEIVHIGADRNTVRVDQHNPCNLNTTHMNICHLSIKESVQG